MDINDIRASKHARIAFYKNSLDLGKADVRVMYGICYISGRITRYPRTEVKSVKDQTQHVVELLKKMGHIKDAVLTCTYEEELSK